MNKISQEDEFAEKKKKPVFEDEDYCTEIYGGA